MKFDKALEIGDEILMGKFRNKRAIIMDFEKRFNEINKKMEKWVAAWDTDPVSNIWFLYGKTTFISSIAHETVEVRMDGHEIFYGEGEQATNGTEGFQPPFNQGYVVKSNELYDDERSAQLVILAAVFEKLNL